MELIILFLFGYLLVRFFGVALKIIFYIFVGIVALGMLHSCMVTNSIMYLR